MEPIAWEAAREIAASGIGAGTQAVVPIAQAVGAVLAEPLRALADLPAFDIAASDGWAVAGPGPWVKRPPRARDVLAGHRYHDEAGATPLRDGEATPVSAGDAVGSDVTAVIPGSRCRSEGTAISMTDAAGNATGKVAAGSGIRSRGADAVASQELLPDGTVVSPAAVALAALAGHDDLTVIVPPRVSIIRVGDEFVDFGAPRSGLSRDAVAPALPAWIAAAGGRCEPARWARQGDAELIDHIEDSVADIVVAHGAHSGTALRRVLAGMGADVLIDGVACRPGGTMLLARLPDGRPFAHCGDGGPADAIAALVTIVMPLVAAMAGRSDAAPEVRLDETVRGSRDATWLIPVAPSEPDSSGVTPVLPGGPGGMSAWARASHAAAIPPGGITRHRRVTVLPLPGASH